MLKAIFNFFKKPTAPVAEAPYKVEEAVAQKPKAKKPQVKKATTRAPKKATPRAKAKKAE